MWSNPHEGLHVYAHKLPKTASKVAVFYLNALICAEESTGWCFKYPSTMRRLRRLHEKKYTIVVMSNELAVYNRTTRNAQIKSKIEDICKQLNVPIIFCIAKRPNKFQIPKTGMFEYIMQQYNNIDFDQSFYCGDNANGTSSRDSCFAKACNLKFINDEQYFTTN
jgi:DNA 3'-phosphatase